MAALESQIIHDQQFTATWNAMCVDVFERAGCHGWLCALDVDRPDRAVCVGADEPVVAASVAKVQIALELFRHAESGELDPAERVRLRPAEV